MPVSLFVIVTGSDYANSSIRLTLYAGPVNVKGSSSTSGQKLFCYTQVHWSKYVTTGEWVAIQKYKNNDIKESLETSTISSSHFWKNRTCSWWSCLWLRHSLSRTVFFLPWCYLLPSQVWQRRPYFSTSCSRICVLLTRSESHGRWGCVWLQKQCAWIWSFIEEM